MEEGDEVIIQTGYDAWYHEGERPGKHFQRYDGKTAYIVDPEPTEDDCYVVRFQNGVRAMVPVQFLGKRIKS